MPRQADGVPGIHVRKVEAESPADEAGLRTDDTIQRVEGQSLEPLQLQARISGLEVGEELNVEVQRGPEGLELTFRAREREVAALMYWTWQPLAAAGFAALALAACFAPRPRLRGALEWFERIAAARYWIACASPVGRVSDLGVVEHPLGDAAIYLARDRSVLIGGGVFDGDAV